MYNLASKILSLFFDPLALVIKVIPAVNAPIASMFSTMSRSRCAGFLEGMHGIAEDRLPEQRFESFAVDEIGRATQ